MHLYRARHLAIAVALACSALAGSSYAQVQPTKGEQALKYRKAVYQAIAWNFGPLGAMAQGKAPYDAAEFAMRAGRVAALTPMLAESYSPETQDVAGSRLKPSMWRNRADFDARMKTLVERSAGLASIAKGGDEAKSRAAFLDVANACKACHDEYRSD
ncbi:MAG: cytochrome c [Steroidobacteraceae bacterium]